MFLRSAPAGSLAFAFALAGCPSIPHNDDDVVLPDNGVPDSPIPNDARSDGFDAAQDVTPADVLPADVPPDDVPEPMGPPWCMGGADVPGAVVPAGFCMREYVRVNAPRTMTFAPNGDLFVATPAEGTPGGSSGGPMGGAIIVYSDDDHDGVPESSYFLINQPRVHGLAFAGGYLYFTSDTTAYRLRYTFGQRAAAGAPESVAMFDAGSRWTHGMAATRGGIVYGTESTNGVSVCDGRPLTGDVSIINATTHTMTAQARGFRNPMYMRCHFRDETCMASELGEDGATGAREKLFVVRAATVYGYPCCFTQSLPGPFSDARFNCGMVEREEAFFNIGETPFGLDWERGRWPAPYTNGIFVGLHGSFYLSPGPGVGSRVTFASTNPVSHAPSGPFQPFVDGWGPTSPQLRRAADVAFSPDGRLFVSDDVGARIYWVAPTTLRRP